MLTIHITLVSYVRGTAVNLELEADAEAASGLNSEEWLDTQGPAMRSIVEAGSFPVFERLTATHYDFNLENLFEFGLQRLLDGPPHSSMAALTRRRPPAARTRRRRARPVKAALLLVNTPDNLLCATHCGNRESPTAYRSADITCRP